MLLNMAGVNLRIHYPSLAGLGIPYIMIPESPWNGQRPMCLHTEHGRLYQSRACMIWHTKAPCGVAGTSKVLKQDPSKKLKLNRALSNQGFMVLVQVKDHCVSIPARVPTNQAVEGQRKLQCRLPIEQVPKSKPEQLFHLLLRFQRKVWRETISGRAASPYLCNRSNIDTSPWLRSSRRLAYLETSRDIPRH